MLNPTTHSVLLRAAVTALALLAAAWLALPLPAHAGYKVYSPEVERGETELEFRAHNNQDDDSPIDDSGAYLFAVGHAFTSFWFSEVYAEFEYADGEGSELEAIEWENIFQLTEESKYWPSFGLYTEVAFSMQDDINEFKIGPLIEKSFGRTVATLNLFLEREFGPNASDETEFEYAARLLYELNEYFKPAIEAYGSPGPIDDFEPTDEQEHQIGPAFYGEVHLERGEIGYSAAALAGLTDASPDWTFVLRAEYEF